MRKILIFGPIVIIAFLLQSYFWVPTYEEQTKGNPSRLNEYISASIGDASILNPVLSADSASSDIESMVFEGLIDRDEDLSFRGRLAESWEVYEEAYFYINELAAVPGAGLLEGNRMAEFLLGKLDQQEIPDPIRTTLSNISAVEAISAQEYTTTVGRTVAGEARTSEEIRVRVKAPARIKLTLKKVDPDLFTNLSLLLGEAYFSSFRSGEYIDFGAGGDDSENVPDAETILPAVEHNPVVVFHLRPGVRFHDGHILDADDVKFTYEAIMDPKNLSPRTSDYEPVKSVQVVEPLTGRIIYKRLYSPALGTWSIGILPQHLLNEAALTAEANSRGEDPEDFSLRQSSFNRHPVGCGPFVFREWKSDQYISLERFPDYWEGPANYQRYT